MKHYYFIGIEESFIKLSSDSDPIVIPTQPDYSKIHLRISEIPYVIEINDKKHVNLCDCITALAESRSKDIRREILRRKET